MNAEDFHNSPEGKPSLYWRLPAVAALIGIDSSTLLREIEQGHAPIRVAQFGTRGDRFCHRSDAERYVASLANGKVAA